MPLFHPQTHSVFVWNKWLSLRYPCCPCLAVLVICSDRSRFFLCFFFSTPPSPPPKKKKNTGVGYIGITLSLCPSVCLSCLCFQFCLDDVSFTTQPFLTKLGLVVYYHGVEYHAKNWFTVFNVKVTARAYRIQIWLFLRFLLNCGSVCNQTWFDSTTS